MGMSKLDEIVALFQNESRRNARSHYSKWDYARGKSRIGTIDTIQETVAVNKLSSPAIIVIGEVVGDSKKRAGFMKKSNHNTVLVYGKK
jgi:uroporphyrin-III C-methyltransferase